MQAIPRDTMHADLSNNEGIAIKVPAEAAGERLDVFLAEALRDRSRVACRRAIVAGAVTVNGQRTRPAFRLREGDQVFARLPEIPRDSPQAENIPLNILHEDEHIAVVDKPSGMVIHPAKGHWKGTLVAGLRYHLEQLSKAAGEARPGIVHRLDRDTTGVLLVAKTDRAHLRLAEQFHERKIEKEYAAIVAGVPGVDADVIRQPIGLHPYHREKMAIRRDHSSARDAETFFEVSRRWPGLALLRVFPRTGRTHQIRVHLAHAGLPVLCDRLYGGRATVTRAELAQMVGYSASRVVGNEDGREILLARQALHARRIKLAHPVSGELVEFTAPWPADFQRVAGALDELSTPTPPGAPWSRWDDRPDR